MGNLSYYQRPEVKAKIEKIAQRFVKPQESDTKAESNAHRIEYLKNYNKAYVQRPEVKARRRAFYQRPDVRERYHAYLARPDVKARRSEYMKRYFKAVKN